MIQPLYDRVIVRLDAPPERTPNGLFIPDASRGRAAEAVVVAVGNGTVHRGQIADLKVRDGDRVVLRYPCGSDIEIDGDLLLIIREGDIMGILEPVEGGAA